MRLIWGLDVDMVCFDNHDFVILTDDYSGLWPLLYLYPDTMCVVIFCLNCLVMGVQLPKNWST